MPRAKKTLKLHGWVSSLFQVCCSLILNCGIRGELTRFTGPDAASPVINAPDDHVASMEGHRLTGWDRGRAGITQHANFLIGTDDSFRLRQLDPTIAAAGTHHRVRFGHIVEQRRIDAVLAAVFV